MTAPMQDPFGARATGAARLFRWIAGAAVVLAALIAAFVFSRRTTRQTATEHAHAARAGGDSASAFVLSADEARRIGVTYAVASVGPLGRIVRSVGRVVVDETRQIAITTKVDGWVDRLYVDYTGQPVDSGAPLLALYSPMLVTAQDELLLARKLERDVAGGSPTARAEAADLVASARRRLQLWDIPVADIDRIERSGATERALTLRAPAGGFVVEKDVVAGQKVMAGETLYRLADLGTVWLEGDVFEQDLPAVKAGQEVFAELQALPGRVFTGRIAYLYPTLDPETRTARVRVAIRNPRLELKPGMFATIRIAGAERPRTLTVPRSAVLATGERSLVFLKRASGMFEPRTIVTGASSDSLVEVLAGLAPGDTVVASATFLVDAESNLGAALGGMGNMPGMDMTAPTKVAPAPPHADSARRR